jgi:hypothetical protein
MMNPQTLIDPTASPVPAPLWFVQLFKVLGFTLHAVPMNLWFAGVVLAMVLHAGRSENGKRLAGRLMSQMPIIVALGVNLGIVPLLFVQVAYYKVFYPATILMAWFWLAIVVMLIPAYYGVYAYASGLSEGALRMTPLRRGAGWASAILFIVIGFLFANGFSLMANVKAWTDLWPGSSVGGAALGTGLNLGDQTLWPRWLMMFGLAVTTTAVWAVVDAAWLARRESQHYRTWAQGFAWKLYTAGMAWFALTGLWYVLSWPGGVQSTMWRWPALVLTGMTALAPGLPWLLLLAARQRGRQLTRPLASLIGLAQLGVLGINAISRQVVQNVELSAYFKVFEQPEAVEYSPLVFFLLVFVAGMGVVAWMIAQVVTQTARVETVDNA